VIRLLAVFASLLAAGAATAPGHAPTLTSVHPDIPASAALTLTLEGSGFADGCVPEVYDSKGRLVAEGSVTSGSSTRLVATVALAGSSPGTYSVKVRDADGRRSGGQVFTLRPRVSVTPRSGTAGATFTYTGEGFTAGFGAISHLRKPGGLEFPRKRMPVGDDGTFEDVIWSGEFVPGTYTAWAVDDYTKLVSEPVDIVIQP